MAPFRSYTRRVLLDLLIPPPPYEFATHLSPLHCTATCTSVTVSDARDRDGTYEESSDEDDLFYQAGGTTFFEMYPFTGSDHAGWYITDRNTAVYRVSEPKGW